MQNGNIVWFNSIFTRLVITFLLVVSPLYFVGIQIFQWSRDMLTTEIFSSMQAQVSFYINNLENEIEEIRKLQFDCLRDEDLHDLANASGFMSDFEKTKAVRRLQLRLSSIKNSSEYIKSISVHIPAIDRTIRPDGSLKGNYVEIPDDIYTRLKDASADAESQIIFWNNDLYLYAPHAAKLFYIEVELSKENMKNIMLQSNTNPEARSLLVNPNLNFTIVGDNDEKTSQEIQSLLKIYLESKESDTISVEAGGRKYLLIYAYSDYTGMVLARYIPEEVVFEPLGRYKLWYWAFTALAFIIIVLYSISTYRFIQRPLQKLVNSFRKIEKGKLDIQIQHSHKDEFRYLYSRFNEMVNNLKTLIDQVYNQKILTQRAEMKQLQSQIKPHFLYNSFFILQRRISKGDYENAEKFAESLGHYFKFITRSDTDEVSLINEVKHAKIYADIQAMRFSNRTRVDFGILPQDCENIKVPRLIMQPIIENAFEHGLEDKEENGMLKIDFIKEGKLVKIVVEDNGDRLEESELTELQRALKGEKETVETTGILNIHKRIRLALGENSGISASRSQLGGLRIEIKLEMKED